MDLEALPRFLLILLTLVLIFIVFAKVLNYDIVSNLASMIMSLSKGIFSGVAF
ncbi:MAG: hypothetical protein ACP5E4_00240 [Candidatus Aenigmatarchaeota archaeon]